jgi:hypothetical protein
MTFAVIEPKKSMIVSYPKALTFFASVSPRMEVRGIHHGYPIALRSSHIPGLERIFEPKVHHLLSELDFAMVSGCNER